MTRPLNQKQRAFCRAIAEGAVGAEAQKRAGYRPNRKHKNLLLADPRVSEEIGRLRRLVESEWARRQCDKLEPE